MDTVQEEVNAAASAFEAQNQNQSAVRTWLSSKKGAKMPGDPASRFHGDGVRYKAKLIGVDPVVEAQGDKMCVDAMMKLKGLELAGRSQGKHKQKVWLKISTSGLKMVDERTGVVEHDHVSDRISSLRKDESDPRALAYIYHQPQGYCLFYIKTANLADPVLDDITSVCQSLDQETAGTTDTDVQTEGTQDNVNIPFNPDQAPDSQNSSLLLLEDNTDSQQKVPDGVNIFSPLPSSPTGPPMQTSSRDELMDIFSVSEPKGEELQPAITTPPTSPNGPQGPPRPTLSKSQILANYSSQPAGGSPYPSPANMPWGQQGPFSSSLAPGSFSPWPSPASLWPAQPGGGVAAWAPGGGMMPPGGGMMPPGGGMMPPGGGMMPPGGGMMPPGGGMMPPGGGMMPPGGGMMPPGGGMMPPGGGMMPPGGGMMPPGGGMMPPGGGMMPPGGGMMPPGGAPVQAFGNPGVLWAQATPVTSLSTIMHVPSGGPWPQQPVAPATLHQSFLG